MKVTAQHKETGQTISGLLTTARRALPNTWHNWKLKPNELVIKQQHRSCNVVYELRRMINIRKWSI